MGVNGMKGFWSSDIVYLLLVRTHKSTQQTTESKAGHLNSASSLHSCTSKGFVRLNLAGRQHKEGSLSVCFYLQEPFDVWRNFGWGIPRRQLQEKSHSFVLSLTVPPRHSSAGFYARKTFILILCLTVCLSALMGESCLAAV